MALITLITPVTALLLGYGLADEPLNGRIVAGAGLVAAGLAAYEWPNLRRLADLTGRSLRSATRSPKQNPPDGSAPPAPESRARLLPRT